MTSDRQKIASDGLSTDYYKLPETRKLHEIIEHKNMTPGIAYIFQSCYNMGKMDNDMTLITLMNIHAVSSSVISNYNIQKVIECQVVDWETDKTTVIPNHATELRHLISHASMSKSRGDIFKACYRLGEKAGTDILYDLNKIMFFTEDLLEMHSRHEHI
jgi:hypothetical protein